MRLTAAVLGLALFAAPAFAEPGAGDGAAVYDAKCKMCHASGMANAPLIEKLATFDNQKILAALADPSPIPMILVSNCPAFSKARRAPCSPGRAGARGAGPGWR